MHGRETDVTSNIKVVEILKNELLSSVASLFHILLKGAKASQDALIDILANIILLIYLMAKRLGIGFFVLENKVIEKAKLSMLEENETENWHKDLSDIYNYFSDHNH